jgi:ssDNA-binding Zn-finger/Zn-ribbon topoisomerase 1
VGQPPSRAEQPSLDLSWIHRELLFRCRVEPPRYRNTRKVRKTVIATAKGHSLPRSAGTTLFLMKPEICSHPENGLANRGSGVGSRQSWVTCLWCGSRWERRCTEGVQRREAVDQGSTSVLCRRCGQPMVLRAAREDASLFLGCSGYPTCRATRPVETRDAQSIVVVSSEEEEEHPASALWQAVRAGILAGSAPEIALAAVVPSAESPSHVRWLGRKVQECVACQCETPSGGQALPREAESVASLGS